MCISESRRSRSRNAPCLGPDVGNRKARRALTVAVTLPLTVPAEQVGSRDRGSLTILSVGPFCWAPSITGTVPRPTVSAGIALNKPNSGSLGALGS